MKIKTTVKALKTAVDAVKSCVSSKPLMPVLGGIKIDVDDNLETVLTAFDLANGLQVYCDTEEAETGSIVILEKDLSAILSKLSGEIEIEVVDTTVTFSNERSQIEIQGLDSSEYPDTIFNLDEDAKDEITTARLPAKSFLEAIERCSVSASTDETKQILQGINISCDGTIAKLASTDGHRLTVCSIPCETEISSATLPAKFLSKMPRFLDESIDLSIANNQALIKGDSLAICRLYEGKYPDYQLLLPKEFTRHVTVDRQELIELLAVAEIAATSSLVTIEIARSELSIRSDRDAAKAISTMDCDLSGDPIEMGMNHKYLSQGLKIFEDEKVTININGETQPVTIVSLDKSTTHLIMPTQIRK